MMKKIFSIFFITFITLITAVSGCGNSQVLQLPVPENISLANYSFTTTVIKDEAEIDLFFPPFNTPYNNENILGEMIKDWHINFSIYNVVFFQWLFPTSSNETRIISIQVNRNTATVIIGDKMGIMTMIENVKIPFKVVKTIKKIIFIVQNSDTGNRIGSYELNV